MTDLSILIPARNEMFLSQTVSNILENIAGDTEIIAILDGEWADPPMEQHERVTLVYLPESIGQRAATNLAARMSKAKYVMKCDAHCSFDEGFDVKMMDLMEDDITMVPTMYNLHAFDWVCVDCKERRYQGPSGVCTKCGGETKRDILWYAKPSPETTAMRFDRDLRFQYWGQYKERQEGDLVETMSILGACFMLTREKYLELDICDELHGSWGQQGTEVACKTWLSGGRLLVNRKTWFAHMFRTQGGDFGFPYEQSGKQLDRARKYSRELWQGNRWKKAIHPLTWLINKFSPIPDWDINAGILYYTDSELDKPLADKCRAQLQVSAGDRPIISVSLKPLSFGENIRLDMERGYLTMFKQILMGLKALDTDIVFFAEHDVMYNTTHFDFIPMRNDVYYYNSNVWKVRHDDGHALYTENCRQTSGLCANRLLLIQHYEERVKRTQAKFDELGDTREYRNWIRKQGFEPGTHRRTERVDDHKAESWESSSPILDIRHDSNLTPSRWKKEEFRNSRYTRGWKEKQYDLEEIGAIP